MPHFIIDCSEKILELQSPEKIMKTINNIAEETGLFKPGDIKVRMNPYKLYNNNNTKKDFIHVFAHIMEGRTVEQKAGLSKQIVTRLMELFPRVPIISMNVQEFEKATYFNKNML